MEKLKMRNLSWSMNGLEIFKVLNWKKNCGRVLFQKTFTSFRNDPFLEIDSITVAKICWYFRKYFLQEHAPVSSFSQLHKPITRERNVIEFSSCFIYGGHFMNRRCQASNIQTGKCKNITSKQPLNWIRLIRVGNIQGCFLDFKLYFSLSKKIQN